MFNLLLSTCVVQKVTTVDFLTSGMKCPLRSIWSQSGGVSTSLQPSFYVSFDITTCFPFADIRISTGKGMVLFCLLLLNINYFLLESTEKTSCVHYDHCNRLFVHTAYIYLCSIHFVDEHLVFMIIWKH